MDLITLLKAPDKTLDPTQLKERVGSGVSLEDLRIPTTTGADKGIACNLHTHVFLLKTMMQWTLQ